MKDTEEVTRPDVLLLKYDIDAMRERWLRTEHKYDCISAAQRQTNIKNNIIISTQLIIIILLGLIL